MAKMSWLEAYGLDPEQRAQRVRRMRRIKRWGLAMVAVTVAGIVYLLLWEPPESASDAFGLAVAFATLLAAGFALITRMETEIQFCQLLDELKK